MKKRSVLLACFVVAAQTFLETSPSLWAKATDVAAAKEVVQTKLVDPLQKKEGSRSRFSRAAMPPAARRVRILDNSALTDAKGRTFVPFSIDESRGFVVNIDKPEDNWIKDTITGCVYQDTGDVLVKRGEVYYASSVLWGAQTPVAPAESCHGK